MTSVYGELIGGTAVRKAVRDTIKLWAPSYLGEVAEQNGHERAALPDFKSFRSSPKGFDHWPEEQLPSCLIVCPGPLAGSIERKADQFSAEFPVGVGALCSASDLDFTLELVEMYTLALRALLVQHGSLGGFASKTMWVDEDYDELPSDSARTFAGGAVNIRVRVDAVLDSAAGLMVPPPDPVATPAPPSVVETTDVDVNQFTQEIDL